MPHRNLVFERIDDERDYQDSRWTDLHTRNEAPDYLTYLLKYYRKAEAFNMVREDECLEEMRKLAGLAVCCMEKRGTVARASFPVDAGARSTKLEDRTIIGPVDRAQVYAVITDERVYQEGAVREKFSKAQHARPLTIGGTLTLIREYLRRADKAWTDEAGEAPCLDVVRKIAAICVRCLEERGCPKRKWKRSR